MIPYVNDKLNRWAEWRLRGRFSNGLGYPSAATFMRLTPAPTGRACTPSLDEEGFEVEKAFTAMQVKQPELAKVLFLFHCRGGGMTVAQMARECGFSSKTFYSRVDRGHREMLVLLDGQAGGELQDDE
ncbi:hypothetical protein ACNQFN_10935 [Thauera butanivorans]|uniref:hypothetical protein n=1 Tax=Thauera butanivorans TaxID=86174 RepID=UPI003AB55E80